MKKPYIDFETYFSECKQAFGFLTTKHQFSKPENINKNNLYDVIFYKNNLAIECSYDVRDSIASIYIVKLHGGKKPNCYRINGIGEIVREHLNVLLLSQGVKKLDIELEIDSRNIIEPQLSLRKYLMQEAYILKTYGSKILNDSTDIFNNIIRDNGDQF